MDLTSLYPPAGSKKERKRIGRGHGSGQGKTAGKGHKGQKARSGGGVRPGFEGGQMPLQRRVPKRGFNNIFAKKFVEVQIKSLEKFENDQKIDAQTLLDAGIISKIQDGIRIIGNDDITKKLTVQAKGFSKSAKAKIEAAGGIAEVI